MSDQLYKTPLYEEHIALGARMVPFAGWAMPVQYEGIIEEHKATRSSAGLFDVCHMGQVRVFGFGAFDFLQSLLTNDLGLIATLGEAQYTLMCDEDGGIIDDLIVYHTGDLEYMIVVNASNRETDLDWMRARLAESVHAAEVEIADESDRTALLALQGPRALEIIGELAGEGFEPPARFTIAEARLDATPVLLARTGYTGEDGVEIVCHAAHAAGLWRMLLSFPEVTPCGLGARDTLRLEMGYPLYGQDMDRGVDPVSAGLGWTVARDKGPFVGSEAIERVREAGAQRRLTGLLVDGAVPRPGMSVLHDGVEVGKVASGTYSPTLSTGIATSYVPVALSEAGTVLEVAVRKKTVRAVVTRPPFVRSTSLSKAQA